LLNLVIIPLSAGLIESKSELELTVITAIILVCSVAITPNLRDCTVDNAIAVPRVPAEFASPVTCFMQGQAYLAETSIGQDLGNDDRVKVICDRRETIDTSLRPLKISKINNRR
jgi:hypothetical protein